MALHQAREKDVLVTATEGLRVQQGILMTWLEREGCISKPRQRENLKNEIQRYL